MCAGCLTYSVRCGVRFLAAARGGQCSAAIHSFLDMEGPLPPHALRVVACLGDYLRNISGVSWRFNPSGVEHKLQWRGSIFFYELGGARIICRVVCRGGPFRQRPSDGHTHQVARGGKAWRPVSRASCYLTELSARSTLSAAVSSAMIMVADASIVRSRLDGGEPRSKLRQSMRASCD